MNIIILFESDKQDDGLYHLSDYRAEHIRSILKSQINDRLEIGILNGQQGTASVQSITENEIILSDIQLEEPLQNNLTIDIIVALPRPQTVKKVLFISAMMGVRNIFFIRSNRVEKSFFHSPLLEEKSYNRFLIDGLQQGKNTLLPVVSIHDKFKPFMQDSLRLFYEKRQEQPFCLLPDLDTEHTLAEVVNIGADEGVYRPLNANESVCNVPTNRHPERSRRVDLDVEPNNVIPVKTGIQKLNAQVLGAPLLGVGSHLLFAIGPEGGWVPYEIEMMTSLGFHKFKLGGWTLRVEHALTACLAQTELLM